MSEESKPKTDDDELRDLLNKKKSAEKPAKSTFIKWFLNTDEELMVEYKRRSNKDQYSK